MCTGVLRTPFLIGREHSLTQHPMLYVVDVRCSSCGASFAVRSTAEAISTDVCSNCHHAYTGRERGVASGSRIARFNRRRALAAA
jgi:large subunit ribosomal protein L31